MRTIMPRASHDTPSSSTSKRNFKWMIRRGSGGGGGGGGEGERRQWKEEEILSSSFHPPLETATAGGRRRSSAAAIAVSRFRSVVMSALLASRSANSSHHLGSRITGTLYGHRRGHVHLAFQVEPKSCPVVLLELATPTSNLVREMASGLVRIALECERGGSKVGKECKRLMEEPLWRAYCNGRKCGYAVKRECGTGDWKVLKAVEPVSMGAGVLPRAGDGEGPEGEMMYMRARFERVVGSRDSEAFYMMNPDGNGGTELSIYFLRV